MEAKNTLAGFTISTDKSRLDIARIHRYLATESYWAQNIPIEILERAIDGSVCFGVYDDRSGAQVGFARVITDHATFAYLCDVFIVTEAQGHGLGKALVRAITEYLEPLGCRRWALVTRDAHGLYAQFGFAVEEPGKWMGRRFVGVYDPTP